MIKPILIVLLLAVSLANIAKSEPISQSTIVNAFVTTPVGSVDPGWITAGSTSIHNGVLKTGGYIGGWATLRSDLDTVKLNNNSVVNYSFDVVSPSGCSPAFESQGCRNQFTFSMDFYSKGEFIGRVKDTAMMDLGTEKTFSFSHPIDFNIEKPNITAIFTIQGVGGTTFSSPSVTIDTPYSLPDIQTDFGVSTTQIQALGLITRAAI